MKFELIGWIATAVFASSYLWKQPQTLRRIQAIAAVLWVIYGVIIQAMPVIVANLIVAGAACWTSWPRLDVGRRKSEDM